MTPRAVHRRLLRPAPAARVRLGATVAVCLLSAVLLVVQAAALAKIVDGAAFRGADVSALSGALWTLAAAVAGRALLAAATEWWGRRAAELAMGELRRLVGDRIVAGRAPRVDEARAGELATAAVHGVDALAEYYARAVPQLALAAAVPVGIVGVVLVHDPVVGALLGLTLPVVVVFMVLVGRASAAHAADRRQALGTLGAHFLDVMRGLGTLHAHGRMEAQAETLGTIGERYRVESIAALRVAFLSALVLELLAMVGTAIAAAVVGVQLAEGRIGFETGLLVLLLAPEIYVPLRLAGQRYHAAEDGASAAAQLFAVLDGPPMIETSGPARAAPDPAGVSLWLRDVVVAGGAGRAPALDGLSLDIAPLELVAVVGESGAGKSTLLRLLARLADPDRGSVGCGNLDLRAVDPTQWWTRVAWLPQRPALLRGTLADALRHDARDATDDEIGVALRRAAADEVLAALPDGLDTRVGAGGRGLSWGQTQRLALAGALVTRAPLLLLDEPTAHLDRGSAARAADGIRAAAVGRTVVVATHDPNLAARCHRVVSLGERAAEPRLVAA
jgi:thiol reductant ABC exporter CydD subunit